MLNSFSKPKVGCLHFKSTVKQIRSENNTFASSINDIIDNIHGLASKLKIPAICDIQLLYDDQQNMYKVLISDNIIHGFKDIFNQGTDNPLNMGHIRFGHDDDEETSEFGTGFKKDIIYLAQSTEIYTRSVNDNETVSFLKISFEIPEMCARINPEDSYEPTNFEVISEEQFKLNHKFEVGSTVILSNLRQTDVTFDMETGKRITNNQFEKILRTQISKANSGLIRSKIITIKVNDIVVEPEPDLFELVPESNQSIFILYCELNNKNEPNDIFREGITATGRSTVMKYNPRENKFKKSSSNELNVFKFRPSVFTLGLLSLTTKHTKFESNQHNDMTDIIRSKRCFGSYKITKQEKDGYSNHIYNRISYNSKKLNTLIGVGSNKRVDPKNNILMSAIYVTQKETTCKFRKFCKSGTLDDSSESKEIIVVKGKGIQNKKKPESSVTQPVINNSTKIDNFVPSSDTQLPLNNEDSLEPPLTQITTIAVSEPIINENENQYNSEKIEEPILHEDIIEKKKKEPLIPKYLSVQEAKDILLQINEQNHHINSNIIEKVTKIILKYIETPEILIFLKYIPLDHVRIQILMDILEQSYETNTILLKEEHDLFMDLIN
jgi:hypothetical protein